MASDLTVLGCPFSSIQSLEAACAATAIPSCAMAITTASVLDNNCCASLYSFGESLGSCYLKNAPTCLDTAAAASSLTAGGSASGVPNPCAGYNPGGAGAVTMTSMSSAPSSAGSSGASSTAASAASNPTSGGAPATGTSSAASTSSTAKSAAPKVGAGLKVYLGVALVGALAVLSM